IISKLPDVNSPKMLDERLKESLSNLNREKLYGYLFHHFKTYKSNPDLLETLYSKRDKGVVEKVGFSLYYETELEELLEKDIQFDVLQIPFNIFDHRFRKYFALLKKRGVEIHVRSVFLQGLLLME